MYITVHHLGDPVPPHETEVDLWAAGTFMVFLLSLEYPSLGGFNIMLFYRIVVCLCTGYIERVRFDADFA